MAKKHDAIITEARERYEYCVEADSENRDNILEDMEFRAGEQWPEKVRRQREADMRPVVVVDKLNQYIRQIVNDQRQNRPAIKVRPVDDNADPEVAEILTGVVRHIEDQSQADMHYDTAHEHAVSFGTGWLRVRTEYEDDRSFDQSIVIESLRNPLSAYIDPDCMSPVGADAEYAFITERMPREVFKRKYPKADQLEWDAVRDLGWAQHWCDEKTLRIAEYWRASYEDDELVLLSNGMPILASELEKYAETLQMAGITVDGSKSRAIQRRVVKWRKVSGSDVLEETDWPSQWLGLIPVYGNVYTVGEKVKRSGVVRAAMDAQRIYNYQVSNYIERVALAPKAPFIAADGQVDDYIDEWATANTSNHAVLRYKPVNINGVVAPPPQRQPGADVPVGLVQGMQLAEHDIQSTIGMYAASLGDRSNEKSGRAIMARQREGDVATFHYIDNLSRAIRQVGRIIVDMLPRVYDTQRVLRIIGEDGSVQTARSDPQLSRPLVKQQGESGVQQVFNPTMGKYDVAVSVGPSYTTRRQESAEAMMQFVQAQPGLMQVIGDLLVKAQDWPGADDMAERLRSMLPPNLQGEEGGNPEADAVKQQASQVIEQMQAQMQQMGQALQQAQGELQAAKTQEEVKRAEVAVKQAELQIKWFEAETDRLKLGLEQAQMQQQAQQEQQRMAMEAARPQQEPTNDAA